MENRKKNDGWFYWLLMVIFFCVGLWPVGLIMLFSKLFGSDRKKVQAPPPLDSAAPQSQQKQLSRAEDAVRRAARPPKVKKSNAWLLKILGAIFLFFGVACAGVAFEDSLYYGLEHARWWLPELLQGLGITTAGGGMLFSGLSMDRSLKRYTKYLSVMGTREAVAIEELARTLGYPQKRVEKDLQKMIDKNYFGNSAYLNMELGYLFRNSEADSEWKRKLAEEQEQREAQEAREAYSAQQEVAGAYEEILQKIHRTNQSITDPALSAKIEQLEEITRKIFQAVEADPKKRAQIDTFLNYYLPTTQKLLDSYVQFESAGVEGENLRQAKARIESTMDSLVKGFAHQLDELYKADAMDVDSDIRVMEHMLRRDTASASDDFGTLDP